MPMINGAKILNNKRKHICERVGLANLIGCGDFQAATTRICQKSKYWKKSDNKRKILNTNLLCSIKFFERIIECVKLWWCYISFTFQCSVSSLALCTASITIGTNIASIWTTHDFSLQHLSAAFDGFNTIHKRRCSRYLKSNVGRSSCSSCCCCCTRSWQIEVVVTFACYLVRAV